MHFDHPNRPRRASLRWLAPHPAGARPRGEGAGLQLHLCGALEMVGGSDNDGASWDRSDKGHAGEWSGRSRSNFLRCHGSTRDLWLCSPALQATFDMHMRGGEPCGACLQCGGKPQLQPAPRAVHVCAPWSAQALLGGLAGLQDCPHLSPHGGAPLLQRPSAL